MRLKSFFPGLMIALLAACSAGPAASPTIAVPTTAVPTLPQPTVETVPPPADASATVPAPTASPTSITLDPADWKNWSVIPTLSPEMLAIYQNGQAIARDPHVVSVIGDC